jgi:hypothetical protein
LTGYQSIELPSGFDDPDRTHPVRVYFKGMPYAAQVYPLSDSAIEELPSTGDSGVDGAVRFYARLWKTLAEDDIEGFAAMHGEADANTIRNADRQRLVGYYMASKRRQINYVFYSDNVYWLVYKFTEGPYEGEGFVYDVIVRDETTKEYRRVRINYQEAIDTLLRWPELSKQLIAKYFNEGQDRH